MWGLTTVLKSACIVPNEAFAALFETLLRSSLFCMVDLIGAILRCAAYFVDQMMKSDFRAWAVNVEPVDSELSYHRPADMMKRRDVPNTRPSELVKEGCVYMKGPRS